MKFIPFLLILLGIYSPLATAYEVVNCDVKSNGTIHEVTFETLVDVMSIANAKTMIVGVNGELVRFFRTDIDIKKKTTMTFVQRKNKKIIRSALVTVEQTPRIAWLRGGFKGQVIIYNHQYEKDFDRILNAQTAMIRCRF